MRPMRLATRLILGSLLSLSALGQELSNQGKTKILDLTHVPSSARRSMGAPGGYAGGLSDGTPLGILSQKYDIPVSLKIDSLRPMQDSQQTVLTLAIVNVSNTILKIPLCLNPYHALVTGAHNRRSLNFGLTLDYPGTSERSETVEEVTFGSDSVPDCLLVLEPGEVLKVAMNTNVPSKPRAPERGEKADARARAFIEEWRFDDSRYVVKQKSKRIESDSTPIGF